MLVHGISYTCLECENHNLDVFCNLVNWILFDAMDAAGLNLHQAADVVLFGNEWSAT